MDKPMLATTVASHVRRRRGVHLVLTGAIVVGSWVAAAPAHGVPDETAVFVARQGRGPVVVSDRFALGASGAWERVRLLDGRQVRSYACRYDLTVTARVSGEGDGRAVARAALDRQPTEATNRFIELDLADTDRGRGAGISFGGHLTTYSPRRQDCSTPLGYVDDIPYNWSERVVAGHLAAPVVSAALYGALSIKGADYFRGAVLHAHPYDAAVGCLSGVVGTVVATKITDGFARPAPGAELARCGARVVRDPSVAAWFGWLARHPRSLQDAVAGATRRVYGSKTWAHFLLDDTVRGVLRAAARLGRRS